MSKKNSKIESDEMLDEYDFSNGTRGKYAKSFSEGTNIVLLDADVAELFPDSAAVNDALRSIVRAERRGQENDGTTSSVPSGSSS